MSDVELSDGDISSLSLAIDSYILVLYLHWLLLGFPSFIHMQMPLH